MFISKKRLSRRTLLRSSGAAIGLPLLDSMTPAMAAAAEVTSAPQRLGVVYVPHGAVMEHWTPKTAGADFEVTSILEPIARFRDSLTVVSGLDNKPALIREGEPIGGHGNISGAFLTGVHAKPTEGANVETGVSMDQIAAQHFAKETQLGSLELSLEDASLSGACDSGFSCSYVNTLSWRTPTTPVPVENNPRAVFERLFGDSDSNDAASRRKLLRKQASILDAVGEKIGRLQRRIGSKDRNKLTEYLESVRDVERRIQNAEQQKHRDLPELQRPSGAIPPTFEEHCKIMMDLNVLAYQTDMTRVVTFMIGKELSSRSYPEIGVPEAHHGLSHHQNRPASMDKLVKVSRFHMQMFAYMLDKMSSTSDGDGSLLDHVALLYGSGMSNSNLHDPTNLPMVVAGRAGGKLPGGRHVRCEQGRPLTDLYLTLLDTVGVAAERIGDSTGKTIDLT